eukprot:scaffold6124_cov122-Cylindrotheca_fusiformis.AAC.16
MIPRPMIRLTIFLLFICAHTVSSSRVLYYNHLQLPTQRQASAYRSRRSHLSRNSAAGVLVARKQKKTLKTDPEPEPVLEDVPEAPVITFDDLTPVGKVVAGITQIAVTTLLEFVSGFVTGLVVGTVVGTPGLLFRPLEPGVPKLFMTEMKGRLGRMNSRSLTWAKSWGGISAAFGGFKVGVRVLRNGKEDDWNQILSSAAAGAFFARAEGPQGMLKGALLYGGAIYLLSGGMGGKTELQQYTEEPVTF